MTEMKFLDESTGKLKPAVFCFTGKSPKPRSEMEAIALKTGALVTKSVTNKTTILVIADPNSQSSKAVKARTAGIDLISPEQFFDICENVLVQKYATKKVFKWEPETHKFRHPKDKSIPKDIDKPISQFVITKPKPVAKDSKEKRKHSSTRRIQL